MTEGMEGDSVSLMPHVQWSAERLPILMKYSSGGADGNAVMSESPVSVSGFSEDTVTQRHKEGWGLQRASCGLGT